SCRNCRSTPWARCRRTSCASAIATFSNRSAEPASAMVAGDLEAAVELDLGLVGGWQVEIGEIVVAQTKGIEPGRRTACGGTALDHRKQLEKARCPVHSGPHIFLLAIELMMNM